MPASLQFWVGTTSTLAPLARLDRIDSASINLKLNDPGNVSLNMDRSDPNIFRVTPLTSCILVYRNGNLVWSGPVWTVQESYSGESKKVTVNAVGWFELLNHRVIRSQPGYSLTTSAITWSNGTFESAVSGYTNANSSTARDTSVFHGGAGSWGWSESITGPFGNSNPSDITYQATSQVTPLSATPTAAKRYRANFWARARKSAAYVGNSYPSLEVYESGILVSSQSYQGLFSAGIATALFTQQYVEWVSTGINPVFRWVWNLNPSQMPGSGSASGDWTSNHPDTVIVQGSGYINMDMSTNHNLAMSAQSWSGQFEPSKVYKITLTYNLEPTASVTMQIFDGSIVGASLGSVSLTSGVGTRTSSFTWTATSNGLPFLYIGGTATGNFRIYEVKIEENATDTAALLNVDDITLQEYTGDGIYSNTDAGAIASALLQKVNADSPSKITPGSVETTQPRTRTYQQFSNVGKEIKALSDIESGYDFVVDPITRALNIYNRTNATNFPTVVSGQAGSGSWVYSANRSTAVKFEYGTGSDNLSSVTRTQDSSTVVNRLNVKGKYALGFAQDLGSISSYGTFEDLVSLPDVIDASTSVLPFYANAEIAFRKNPRILYDIQTKTASNTPKLFIDFNIGDRATLNVKSAIIIDNIAISQQIRIFGIQLSVDPEGNERLSGIQLSA